MTGEQSGNEDNKPKTIKKITLPDGYRVGIINLDNILKEVAELNLSDKRTIQSELLKRVKMSNYVPSGADEDYSKALFTEYQKKYGTGTDTLKMSRDAGTGKREGG